MFWIAGLLTLALALAPSVTLATTAVGDTLMAPYLGTWRVNVELSLLRALGDPTLPQQDPTTLSKYVNTMSRIMELTVGDSLITYSRGRHSKSFPFQVLGSEPGGKLHILADPAGQQADWLLQLTADGNLYIESSATLTKDFWTYERGSIERDENGMPALMAKPPKGSGGSKDPQRGDESRGR